MGIQSLHVHHVRKSLKRIHYPYDRTPIGVSRTWGTFLLLPCTLKLLQPILSVLSTFTVKYPRGTKSLAHSEPLSLEILLERGIQHHLIPNQISTSTIPRTKSANRERESLITKHVARKTNATATEPSLSPLELPPPSNQVFSPQKVRILIALSCRSYIISVP